MYVYQKPKDIIILDPVSKNLFQRSVEKALSQGNLQDYS